MSATVRLVAAALSGLLFGTGLAMSGMMDPARVLCFLDVAGAWDPSLAFVFAGAVVVSVAGHFFAGRMRKPLVAARFEIPSTATLDSKLLGGAALFGIGWGLVGLCPGPALAGLTLGLAPITIFVAAMLTGMALHRLVLLRPEPAVREIPVR
ncbi:DUF6691 family protein [Lichenifustis flavocetrariae]|uniref:YeeE/YedE family protein n=1 Tax=Lichenifustis flavocetrariae TaxID=2949735 RepID=A0AA41Z1S9_9HYPH|nr:DUF6691 family protein [Lichenifustis flavocetrariae]MCW6511278.1 YeeE/YedE family protein [Lichenifustis flavocetrariae]